MKKIFTAIVFALALFSCGSGNNSNQAPKTFTLNLKEEGKTLDTSTATTETSSTVNALLQEGLTKIDKDNSIKPGLAESWTVSEDGLTWTFKLRDNIKWSNGDPITANDFKYSWLRALDPATASEYSYVLYYIKGAEAFNGGKGSKEDVAIKVIDEKTLEVQLENSTPYFESLVSFITYYPINEKFVNEKGADYALEAENILSSGPYVLESWTHNSEMVFVKNENYYNKDSIKVDKFVAKFIADSGAELNAFKNGEFNMTELTAEQYEEFKDDERLVKVDVATVWYLVYNLNNDVLKNKNIRKAILTAINKEEIVQNVYRNTVSPAYTLTPKGLGTDSNGVEFVDAIGDLNLKYNPEEAKQYLEKGLKELGLTELPEFSVIVNDSGTNKKLAETIQEQVRKNLGVTINIEIMAFKERVARMHSKNFDMVLAGWGGDYKDPMTFLDLFVTNGGNNYPSFSSKEYDEAIKVATQTTDKAKRFEAFKKAEEIIAEEVPVALLFSKTIYFLVDKDYKGYVFPSVGPKMILNYLESTK